MDVTRLVSDAIANPPERRSLRWWVSRIVPPTVATSEFAMAVATLLRYTDLGQAERLSATAKLLDVAVSATHIDPAVTLAVLAISHIGGNRIMALLETLLKPLLNAQREAGIEIGKQEGRAEGEATAKAAAKAQFEAWKERQRAAGVEFVDDDDYDEPENDEPPTSDQ